MGRRRLNNREKKTICEASHLFRTQKQLAGWATKQFKLDYPLSQTTISDILKKKDIYCEMDTKLLVKKTNAKVKHPEIEEHLLRWIENCNNNSIRISDEIIQTKARNIALSLNIQDMKFSNGWIQKFKSRNLLRRFKLHGEAGSMDEAALAICRDKMQVLASDYNPRDIFNMDETGLKYTSAPQSTIGKSRKSGTTTSKKRITIALCANADGTEKLEPIIIASAAKPRCFKKKSAKQLGFNYYYNNSSCWMTTSIYENWLRRLNQTMLTQKRKILLLVDNAPPHSNLQLSSVRVEFFDPNLTAGIQPMDAGIISCFKSKYRAKHWKNAIYHIDNDLPGDAYKVDLLQAMNWVTDSWNAVRVDTIKNCYAHTGIVATGSSRLFPNLQNEIDDNVLSNLTKKLSLPPIDVAMQLEDEKNDIYDNEMELHEPPPKKQKIQRHITDYVVDLTNK